MAHSKETFDGQIAVIGMACVFPGAPDLKTYWQNIVSGKDAFAELPEGRLSKIFYDPTSSAPDRVYCRKGGFIDPHASFDPLAFGITPTIVEDGEPDQFLALKVANSALIDAGYPQPKNKNIGVTIGKGSYQNSGSFRYNLRIRTGQQFVSGLRRIMPDLDDHTIDKIRTMVQAESGPFRGENTIGLVPSFTAAWIANRMDFHGPAYTVDAACASSLLAVKSACDELRTGSCDMMITGGLHVLLDVGFWAVFCHLGVMSRKEQIRPLSSSADGLLIGEGAGFVVLKRLPDAIADNDRIYAVIHGVGVSSDGRDTSIMKPLMEGELRALEKAWAQTKLDRGGIGLVEAHSPGTPVGDKTELTTLGRFFGQNPANEPRAVVGSVKGNIGHAMPAAGAAALIKTVLAVYHGVLPPTLCCEDPHPLMSSTRFRAIGAVEKWPKDPEHRIAGVNAFGFGGTNAHVVLCGFNPHRQGSRESTDNKIHYFPKPKIAEVLIVTGTDQPHLLENLTHPRPGSKLADSSHRCRLAVLDPTPERVAKAHKIVTAGAPWHGRQGIFFAPQGLLHDGGKVAFIYPGVEAEFNPFVEEIARYFDIEYQPFLATLKSSDEQMEISTKDMEDRGIGIILIAQIIAQALTKVGARPDIMCGHSIGEWSGLISAGIIPATFAHDLMASLKAGSLKVPDVSFGFVGCGIAQTEEAISGIRDISISHDNCPHQCIICGKTAAITAAFTRLSEQKVICKLLPFQSGFHSPLFQNHLGFIKEFIDDLVLDKARVEMWSTTTCGVFPADPNMIKQLMIKQLISTVRFRELIWQLHQQGARAFIQIGSGSLKGFVDDILGDQNFVAINANSAKLQGVERITHAALALYVEGAPIDLLKLPILLRNPSRTVMMLDFSTNLIEFKSPAWDDITRLVAKHTEAQPPGMNANLSLPIDGHEEDDIPLVKMYNANMDEIAAAQHEILSALGATKKASPSTQSVNTASARNEPAQQQPKAPIPKQSWSFEFSSTRFPEVLDHAFFPQPEGWPSLSDRYPIAPMTMMIAIMIEEAMKLASHLIPIRIENIRAHKWMHAEPAWNATITGSYDGKQQVDIEIEGYAKSSVIFATAYPQPPAFRRVGLLNEQPMTLSIPDMYKNHMFHGPLYQNMVTLDAMGSEGIRGSLKVGTAKGNVLDTAGQLFGLWAILNSQIHCMPFPINISKIEFFGPEPAVSELIDCVVTNIHPGVSNDVSGDLTLVHHDRIWCRIEHWLDYRVLADDKTHEVLVYPGEKMISYVDDHGFVWLKDRWPEQNQKERVMFRYTNDPERLKYITMDVHLRNDFLFCLLAAKDAVRHFFFGRGRRSIYPAEIYLDPEDMLSSQLKTAFKHTCDLRLSIACKDEMAVCFALEGRSIGVAVEPIVLSRKSAPRDGLSSQEMDLIKQQRPLIDITEAQWQVRVAAARNAYLKLKNDAPEEPKPRLTQIQGEDVFFDSQRIITLQKEGYIIAYTPFDKKENA